LVVRSAWDVDERLSLDATVRYTDELPILKTDSYVTADARLGWRPIEGVELFLVGRHLLDSPHIEFPRQQPVTLPGVVEREINAGLNWRF
ncbi:MAG: TonB-dependent receptor, partial [Gemmatimonadetes bacterium]|nr:TonB-dependent receptor [Gemmatimonadota bacterium]